MSLKIDQGLFNLDFTDYHAILGIPVDSDVKEIRKRYLTIARRLHPDSCMTEDVSDRQRAAELLSKLVNPAYEKLSQEKTYTEYCVLLRLKGQQAIKQQETVVLNSDPARRLAAASDIDTSYRLALKDLAEKQYAQLDRAVEIAGQISELNLVYLMRKESRGETVGARRATPASSASGSAPAASPPPANTPTARVPATREALIAAYLRRSQEFETKQNYPRAILELRDAIRMEPSNSACHSRLGLIYLKTNQNTMAKIHFNKALELDPQDAVALEGKSRLETPNSTAIGKVDAKGKLEAQKPGVKGGKPDGKSKPDAKGKPDVKGKPDNKGSSGGLFGLFGSKKK
ncbi:MAG TPA: J domain-containing protein [Coleofasciculaceae cyanobacterium]|jgi:curved DNA-binding protein CbpA